MPELKHFETTISQTRDGRIYLPVPFDPVSLWGGTTRHLGGSIGPCHFRGVVADFDGARGIAIGAAWLRDNSWKVGDRVQAILTTEGPTRSTVAPDFQAALDDDPAAAAFWDGLAPFYRKAYMRWIDATKRRPDLRALRIAEVVALLRTGTKARA